MRSIAVAASGPSLYRGTSFLIGQHGKAVAAPHVTIVDDPLMPQGLGSRPFDGEGLPSRRTVLVERGVLASYLLDTYSARRLGLRATGHAARENGGGVTVGYTNLYLEPGPWAPEEILRSVGRGLYVTELIGFGVNFVTGDYSRGAVGFWIEDGELAYPVEEITIAGNLRTMLEDVEMVGRDLVFRDQTAAPTVKISRLTVAGQ
jgi:PmbA protein